MTWQFFAPSIFLSTSSFISAMDARCSINNSNFDAQATTKQINGLEKRHEDVAAKPEKDRNGRAGDWIKERT